MSFEARSCIHSALNLGQKPFRRGFPVFLIEKLLQLGDRPGDGRGGTVSGYTFLCGNPQKPLFRAYRA